MLLRCCFVVAVKWLAEAEAKLCVRSLRKVNHTYTYKVLKHTDQLHTHNKHNKHQRHTHTHTHSCTRTHTHTLSGTHQQVT